MPGMWAQLRPRGEPLASWLFLALSETHPVTSTADLGGDARAGSSPALGTTVIPTTP